VFFVLTLRGFSGIIGERIKNYYGQRDYLKLEKIVKVIGVPMAELFK